MLPGLDIVNKLLFPTPQSTYTADDFPGELIWVPKSLNPDAASLEDCVPCLLLTTTSARFFILYLHSNAEDIGRCYNFCMSIRSQFQVHVLAVEYPGYGLCPGQADEDSVTENALVALNFLTQILEWPLDEILVLGRSIGCGPALQLAARHRVYGLVLIAPFISVRELFREYVGRAAEYIEERFANKNVIKQIESPLLLIHGKQDTVVPWTHGQALYRECRTRKRMVIPDDMKHNTNILHDAAFFVLPMLHFFSLPDYRFDDMIVPQWVFDRKPAQGDGKSGECVLTTSHVFQSTSASQRCREDTAGRPRPSPAHDGQSRAYSARPAVSPRAQATPASEVDSDEELGARGWPMRKTQLRSGEAERVPPTTPPDPDDDGAPRRAEDRAIAAAVEALLAAEAAEELAESRGLATAARARFLRMAEAGRGEECDEEVLYAWPETAAQEDEPPEPPEDAGYFKVPPSRGGPGAASGHAVAWANKAAGCGALYPATWLPEPLRSGNWLSSPTAEPPASLAVAEPHAADSLRLTRQPRAASAGEAPPPSRTATREPL